MAKGGREKIKLESTAGTGPCSQTVPMNQRNVFISGMASVLQP